MILTISQEKNKMQITLQANFAEEQRFHVNTYWNLFSQVKQKMSRLKELREG